jgi:uncharacterized protein YcbK (DUF882 family)
VFRVTVLGLKNWKRLVRLSLVAVLSLPVLLSAVPAQAASERAIYLHYTHTKETQRIVFKRNGRYVQEGLNQLNVMLRDWRRNEPAKMDPRLFDLVWEVYQEVGGTQPIHVVSAYRSPQTNAMLAKTSSGVADNSQHMRGTAMDFYIPGVPLSRLRAAAVRKQVGGVGYYPSSGSPFVHLDTGSVRAWPRMTRAQLTELFPDGRTMHLPNDGKPLSQEGYQIALAEWKKCHAYPCNGSSSSGTQVADSASSSGGGRNLMDMLFGGNQQQAAAPQMQVASAPAPRATPQAQPSAPVAVASIAPVMPTMRPADLGGSSLAMAPKMAAQPEVQVAAATPTLPFSTVGSAPLTADELRGPITVAVAWPSAMPSDLRRGNAENAVTALAALAPPAMPTPRVLMTEQAPDLLSAYAPAIAQTEIASAVEPQVASVPQTLPTALPPLGRPVVASTGAVQTAALSDAIPAYGGLFDKPFTTSAVPDTVLAKALESHVAGLVAANPRDFVAPDLEHAADILTVPKALTSDHFAVIYDYDEAGFDPTPHMGNRSLSLHKAGEGLPSNRFSLSRN